MLNVQEKKELKLLKELQKRKGRFLSQEEFERIIYLESKSIDHCCTNPSCTGGRFEDKENCQKCGYLLHIHHEKTESEDSGSSLPIEGEEMAISSDEISKAAQRMARDFGVSLEELEIGLKTVKFEKIRNMDHWIEGFADQGLGDMAIFLEKNMDVLSVSKKDRMIVFREECDGYYSQIYTKEEALSLIDELKKWIENED